MTLYQRGYRDALAGIAMHDNLRFWFPYREGYFDGLRELRLAA